MIATPAPTTATLSAPSATTSSVPDAGPPHGGLSPEQVRSVVKAHTGQLRACYEQAFGDASVYNGGVAIAWRIDAEGRVHEARVVDDNMKSDVLDECILREASSWTFDASDRPTDIGSYPFKFGVRRVDAGR